MKALSLFSGIGGLDLAAQACDIQTIAFCEIEPFPCSILKNRFPGVPVFSDVRKVRRESLNVLLRRAGDASDEADRNPVDVVCGGFPCQDLSVAGKRAGLDGERSGLWFEMFRIVREIRPRYVLAENVRGAVNLALDTVTAGLEEAGYEVRTSLVPASLFGAPHQRYRIFILGVRRDVADALADTPRERLERACEHGALPSRGRNPMTETPSSAAHAERELWPTISVNGNYNRAGTSAHSGDGLATAVKRQSVGQLNPNWVECLQGLPIGWTDPECDNPIPWPGWPAPPDIGGQYAYEPPRTVTGMKNRAARLKALGNCVVPQQAEPMFRTIATIEQIITNNEVIH